jgi:hypothetical protein
MKLGGGVRWGLPVGFYERPEHQMHPSDPGSELLAAELGLSALVLTAEICHTPTIFHIGMPFGMSKQKKRLSA